MGFWQVVAYVLLALALWQAVYCGEFALRLAFYPKDWLRQQLRGMRQERFRPPPGVIHDLYDDLRPDMIKVNAWTSAACWLVAAVLAGLLYWVG